VVIILSLAGASCVAQKRAVLPKEGEQFHQPQAETPTAKESNTAMQARVQASYSQLPLHFEANQGQSDKPVQFLSRGSGYALFLTPTEAILTLRKDGTGEPENRGPGSSQSPTPNTQHPAIVRMQLAGANPQPQVEGIEELPGKVNYFIGNDPAQWRTSIPTYAKVNYRNVYPGVDLVYYGNQRQLEYDFVVAPGTDPGVIQLRVTDQTGQELPSETTAEGDLRIRVAGNEVHLHKPLVYQEIDGVRQEVFGQFVLLDSQDSTLRAQDSQIVGFQVAAYDTSKPLIIDPVLEYSTYFGGSGSEQGHGIAIDTAGNMYVTGQTCSADFPKKNAVQQNFGGGGVCSDAFVTKLDPTGATLIYSTYLGGSGNDNGLGIAADADGYAYVTGLTQSFNFPTAPKSPTGACLAYQCSNPCCSFIDAFVTKLSPSGSALIYSTYLGGSGGEIGYGIALDADKNVYIVGQSGGSTNPPFPTKNPVPGASGGNVDAFVAKFNPVGGTASQPHNENDLVYSTLLGGSGADIAYGVAIDANGNAHVTGRTDGPYAGSPVPAKDFPLVNAYQTLANGNGTGNLQDAFAAKLSAGGSTLIYSTYLGGGDADEGDGIAVDSAGNAYITGMTQSRVAPLFPLRNALQPAHGGGVQDAFVSKFNPTGSLVSSTFLGGTASDWGKGITVDLAGNVYVTGATGGGFPSINPLQACNTNGDVFVTRLKPTGAALGYSYSTCLGGSNREEGHAIAADDYGNAYITGYTLSTNFPTVNPFQPALVTSVGGNFEDAFVAKISAPIDADNDGYPLPQDCDDNNATVHPGATEVCNGIDDNCDGQVDEGVQTTFYQDQDGDSYGNAAVSQHACSAPTGYVANNMDCNDTSAAIHPGVAEVCNGQDDDCDGAVDESATSVMTPLTQSCYTGPSGTAGMGLCHTGTQTCLDGTFGTCAGEVIPTTEVCNGQDDDCNGQVDDGVLTTFSLDQDHDGFGNAAATQQTCTAPSGYVANSTDCNDANAAIYPGAPEACDGQDNDCNGIPDNGFDVGNACSAGVGACQRPGNEVCAADGLSTVCDAVPGTPTQELCGDGIDQDCNGVVDNGFDVGTSCSVGIGACQQAGTKVCASGGLSTECDATPGTPVAEVCGDGIDNDCDGVVDNGCATTYQTSGLCFGAPGHVILQPVNADGASVFKQGSTVAAKFRVCDSDGVSVGHPGVVTDFRLVQVMQGTLTQTVNEAVVSTTPDSAFRWDASAQQWIFNISTKNLSANQTYFYRISLDDGSYIDFHFGLK
jgi:hypothetical protein